MVRERSSPPLLSSVPKISLKKKKRVWLQAWCAVAKSGSYVEASQWADKYLADYEEMFGKKVD
jgi:hypothetical protein